MIRTGGILVDPKNKITDTDDYIAHGEYLRNKVPEYKKMFQDMLRALPSELLEKDEDDEEVSLALADIETKLLEDALKKGYIRGRFYNNELNLQYGSRRPTHKLMEELQEVMGFDPDKIIVRIDKGGPDEFLGTTEQFRDDDRFVGSDALIKDVYVKPHILSAIRPRF